LDEEGITRADVAERLGISRPHVDFICRGDRRPSLELALKIEALTDGAVPVSLWTKVPKHSSD
jgi:transcriptional regulator with XRE-family HTH domain